MKGSTAERAVVLCALGALLVAGCSPQDLSGQTPRAASTPAVAAEQQQAAAPAIATPEDGLTIVIQAWGYLSTRHVEVPDQIQLLARAWDGVSAALPPTVTRTPFQPSAGSATELGLAQFRLSYLSAATRLTGGKEAQATLAYAAIRRMVESLGDCTTTFTDAPALRERMAASGLPAQNAGIGVVIEPNPGGPVIIREVTEEGAAGKAGIKPGDAILKVGDRDVKGLTTEQIASLVRGQEGSSVKLTVERADGTRTQEHSLKRAAIASQPFQSRMLKGDVAYFRVGSFSPDVQRELLTAIKEFEAKSPKGWVLDLRTNGSLNYTDMASVLSKFVPAGPYVYDLDRTAVHRAIGPNGTTLPRRRPIAVLVGRATVGAAAAFAAAVEEHRAGTVIGTRTAGCPGIADSFRLGDGSYLGVTTRRTFTPSGRELPKDGFVPQNNVELTRADLAAGRDPQLDRALSALGA